MRGVLSKSVSECGMYLVSRGSLESFPFAARSPRSSNPVLAERTEQSQELGLQLDPQFQIPPDLSSYCRCLTYFAAIDVEALRYYFLRFRNWWPHRQVPRAGVQPVFGTFIGLQLEPRSAGTCLHPSVRSRQSVLDKAALHRTSQE